LAEAIDPVVEAIDPEELVEARQAVEAIDPEDSVEVRQAVEAIDPEDLVEARQAVETGVHLGVDPAGSTDQAHAPAAAGVPPAWDLEAAAAAAVAVEGGGRHGRRT
jgi:hypothetical protein